MVIPRSEIDFEIEKEVWNIYELDDGTTLKMRTILIKLLRDPTARPPPGMPASAGFFGFNGSFQNIVIVHRTKSELMGAPTPPPLNLEGAGKIEVDFTPFSEEWNVYTLKGEQIPKGMKLRVKLVVSNVFRAEGLYDQFGYPIYHVTSTNAVVPVLPEQRRH